ncbi:MAG TPA: hypothetical protein VN231_00145 [Allosphingosinicella sp.]|nr:hypothetical protein [Allosphingosinicella sp.]
MDRIIIVGAAALLALGGCDRLGMAGGADEDRISGNIVGGGAAPGTAAPATATAQGDAGVTTSRSFAGLGGGKAGAPGGKDPAAAAAVPTASAGGVPPARLVGRWTDDGDCKHDVEFRPDGTFRSYTGGEGRWALAGDLLTLTGGGGTFRLRLQSVGDDAMMTVNEQGTLGRSTRC